MPVTAHAAFAKAARYLRVALDLVPVDPATLRPSPGRDGRGDRAGHRAGRVLRAVVRARGGRPGRRDRGGGGGGRGALPRGRLLRRLDAAVPAPARRRPCRRSTSRCPASPRSRWTCTSTRTRRRASRCCCTATRRCGAPQYFAYARLARLHDGQPGDRVDPLGRPDRGGLRDAAASSATTATCGWPRRPATRCAGWPPRWSRSTGCGCWRPASTTVVLHHDRAGPVRARRRAHRARLAHPTPDARTADIPASIHLTVTAAVAPQVPSFGPDLAGGGGGGQGRCPCRTACWRWWRRCRRRRCPPSVVEGLAGALGLGGCRVRGRSRTGWPRSTRC